MTDSPVAVTPVTNVDGPRTRTHGEPAKPVGTLPFVQVLRGLAALSVVMWHGSRFISPYGTGLGFALFGSGRTMGVDLFFLISGFIMVHTTTSSDGSLRYCRSYFVKRLTRIWPTYVVISVIYVLTASGVAYFSSRDNLRRVVESLTFVPLTNAYPGPVVDFPALAVGWTLNYEMYFYVVFGVSLLFGRARWLAFFAWMALTLVVVPVSVGALTLDTVATHQFDVAYANVVTNPIVWLFVAGVVIGLLFHSPLRFPGAASARYALGISLSFVVWQFCSGFRTEHGLLQSGLSLVPFMAVILLASKTLSIDPPRALVSLGDVSFSLYLVHPLVQEQLTSRFNAAGLNPYASGFSFLFLTTALSLVLATGSHRCLERGLAEWLKRQFLAERRQRAATTTAA